MVEQYGRYVFTDDGKLFDFVKIYNDTIIKGRCNFSEFDFDKIAEDSGAFLTVDSVMRMYPTFRFLLDKNYQDALTKYNNTVQKRIQNTKIGKRIAIELGPNKYLYFSKIPDGKQYFWISDEIEDSNLIKNAKYPLNYYQDKFIL